MSVSDEEICAFADGLLEGDAADRAAHIVAADAGLQRRVARMQKAAAALRGAFAGQLEEPVPDRLTALLEPRLQSRGRIIAFPTARVRATWAMAAAACLTLAFFGGRFAAPDQPMQIADGRIVAAGALERALDTAASGEEGKVRIALSFTKAGDGYCRVFKMESGAGSAGLACGGRDDWTIVALAGAPGSSGGAGYQQAAGDVPSVVLQAAAEQREGDPLDAGAEAAAIRNGWRR